MAITLSAINGSYACNIGFGGTSGGITISNPALSTNLILQSADYQNDAENIEVFDEVGDLAMSAWTNQQKKATLELIIKGTTEADATTQTTTVMGILPGQFLTVSACAKMPVLVGTTWEVLSGPKTSGTNKDAKKFSVSLRYSAKVTAQITS